MSSKFENIFRINRKSLFATLGGSEIPGAFFFRVYLNLKHSVETSPGGGFPKENISFSTYSYFHHPEKFVASTLSMLFEYEESSNRTD